MTKWFRTYNESGNPVILSPLPGGGFLYSGINDPERRLWCKRGFQEGCYHRHSCIVSHALVIGEQGATTIAGELRGAGALSKVGYGSSDNAQTC